MYSQKMKLVDPKNTLLSWSKCGQKGNTNVDLQDVSYMGCKPGSLSTVWGLMACCLEHGTELRLFSVLNIVHPVSFFLVHYNFFLTGLYPFSL